jgi:hypothetical protein
MEPDLEWMTNSGRAQDVLQTIYEITRFSEGQYSPFFQNCGLYAVGSSINQKNPNDLDLVLVGLDFRAIAKYDKIFLQDPETLIAEEIVIKPAIARQKGVINPMSFMCNSSGLHSLWHPLPEAPPNKKVAIKGKSKEVEVGEQDRLEDLDDVHQFMLNGIEYKGEHWAYNVQKGMAGGTALNLTNYCLRQGSISQLVKDFHESITSSFGRTQNHWNMVTPFEPYFHQRECFLTCRFNIHEYGCPADKEYAKNKCECLPIDLIVHAENLHPRYWKQHQQKLNYPYICLHEWPKADETAERPILTNLPQPEFIDPEGKERIRPHKYFFDFLRTAPIKINASTL